MLGSSGFSVKIFSTTIFSKKILTRKLTVAQGSTVIVSKSDFSFWASIFSYDFRLARRAQRHLDLKSVQKSANFGH